MNRVYSLVWNRSLRAMQVVSELSCSRAGNTSPVGVASMRKCPLAAACLGALLLAGGTGTAYAACTVNSVTYINCTRGIHGDNGGYGYPGNGAAGTGSNHGATNGSANDGGAGGTGAGNDGTGQGAGNSGGGSAPNARGGDGNSGGGNGGSGGAGGGGGGSLQTNGVGGGGGGGFTVGGLVGGGGGGGGGVGLVVSGGYTILSTNAVVGGAGGVGGSIINFGGGGGNGGGSGGGGAGLLIDTGIAVKNLGAVAGGNGGNQRTLFFGGGGGGGAGVVVQSGGIFESSGTVVGGNGGNSDVTGGGGGAGVVAADGARVVNSGTILGGNGGAAGTTYGRGGVGAIGLGTLSLTTSGGISGGLAGDGTTRADAVDFSGGGNTLTLESGYSFVGNVASTSGTTNNGDTLALGGGTNGTFDLGELVASTPTSWTGTVQYYGFANYAKTGTSKWQLTGAATGITAPWQVAGGTLEITNGANLGVGSITVDNAANQNATLQVDSGVSLANDIVLNNGATLENSGAIANGNGGAVEANVGFATVNNRAGGTITGEQTGVWLQDGGAVTNDGAGAGIRATNRAGASNGIWIGGAAGTVTNSDGATISGVGTAVSLNDGGQVTNTGLGSSINSDAGSGIYIGGVGTVTNSDRATISAGNVAGSSGVMVTGAEGTVTNEGGAGINGSGAGVYLLDGGNVANSGVGSTITATGAPTNPGWGVEIRGETGTVTNIDGASIGGTGNGVYLGSGGSVTNSGTGSTIRAAGLPGAGASGSNGVFVAGGLGTVSNTDDATISGAGAAVVLLGGGTITNGAGSTIEATGTATGDCWGTGDCAIFVASASDGAGLGGALTLDNAGSIIGNVQMDPTAANVATLAAGGSIAGDLDIGSNAKSTLALTGDAGTSQLYSKAVTGTTTIDGALTKAGSGLWVIDSNDLASVANTTISAGTLQVGNGGTAGSIRNGDIADGGALIFDLDSSPTYSGVISGSGTLAQEGSGTLTLSNANTFTGGTAINAGEVAVGNSAALGVGQVAMAAGTTLGFTATGLSLANAFTLSGDPTFDVAPTTQTDTVSGVITDGSSPGVLAKTGMGTLILTGANSYTGGTTISAGTLQVGNGGAAGSIGSGAITDNGALTYDLSSAATLANTLSGTGSLTQQGAGALTVNGDGSAFTGTTNVHAGSLVVGDAAHEGAVLGGMVNVARGTTVGGLGALGGLDLAGTLDQQTTIGQVGTLHVTGNATFESGSTFNVQATPAGQADQLAVGGDVAIKGGNTLVLADPGNWAPQTNYTIITAGQGVTGKFASVSANLAFLDAVLSYQPNAVELSLERNDVNFNVVATSPNQQAVATAANALGWDNPLYKALVLLDAADAQVAFNQLSGEFDASQSTARINDSRYIRESMDQRLRQGDNDPEAIQIHGTQVTAWAHGWGHWGTTDGDGNAAKLADTGDGLLIGADMPVGTRARVGVTGGASRNSLSINQRNSWGRETSTWLGAFGGFNIHAFSLRGGIAYAWDQVPSNRIVNFPGYSDRLSGNASGDTLTGFVEGAWTFKFGQTELSPFLNLAHTRVETDTSTEAGGAAALAAANSRENVSFSTVGARGEIKLAHHLNVHGELGWQHAYGDTTPSRDLQFVAGGSAFTEYGVPIAKNAGLGRIGIGWHHGSVAIDANYEGLADGGVKDQAAKVSFRVAF